MDLNKLKTIAHSLGVKFMQGISASNFQAASARSLRFDLPDGPQGFNRVKVTETGNGTATITLTQMITVSVITKVAHADIEKTIGDAIKQEAEPTTLDDATAALAAFLKPAAKG